MTRRSILLEVAASLFALAAVAPAGAQCVNLATPGVAATQAFDTLASSGSGLAWTDGSTIAGAYASVATYNASTGTGTAGALYSFGTAAADRALGSIGSNATGTLYYALCFLNGTGAPLASIDVSFAGEQWRNGGNTTQHTLFFEYQVANAGVVTDANAPSTGWTSVPGLDFLGPVASASASALDGNQAANRAALAANLPLAVANGQEIWLRWRDPNDSGNDHGLAVDDFSLTPNGAGGGGPALSIDDVAHDEGDAGPTIFTFTVSLSAPAGPGGVTFDIGTADGTATTADGDYLTASLTGQTILAGSSTYLFDVVVNGDGAVEPNETFLVNVTNVTGATVADGQGQGTILNDDIHFIHDVQGSGASSPLVGMTVTVEGVVVGDYQTQGSGQLRGFFLEEEDADQDADAATSEGIFVFCSSCPTPVAEGERVRATGMVSVFFGMTQISATSAPSVVVVEAGNHLGEVTPAALDLPVTTPTVDEYYEAREGMRVTFVDTLTVSEYFQLARFGTVELYQGGRPFQFTATSAPGVPGFAAHLDALARRSILLDDADNVQNAPLALPDGSQFVYHPRANGGLSVGTQGPDFFRGGDVVSGLTGVLHWSFAGASGTDAWRVRPTAADPVTFTVANPRPPAPPVVGGAVRAASFNPLNYFTTIDSGAAICGPANNVDCRGADSAGELARQRERMATLLCGLDADVLGLAELENTAPSGEAALADLTAAVNALCGGADPYAFVVTGGTLGSDVIRVGLLYRSATLAPVGPALVDLDPAHDRPPTAQAFDVVDPGNPAFGRRFSAIAVHFKSKGCAGASGADLDQLDGQGCFNARRVAQATRLLAWINGSVVPAAGDPDVVVLGDFNFYAQEDPAGVLAAGGYTDLVGAFAGPGAYSYLFDGQLGRFDYAFASSSLSADSAGAGIWHVDADEVPLFDYSDEVVDAGESAFEEKPDGSALVPPRVVFQPASPYRASDHDPVLAGLFRIADLSVTKSDAPDPVIAGGNLVYSITVTNSGPDPAANVAWSDTLPAATTFVSLVAPGGWSCGTPAVGAGGTIDCSIASLGVGSAAFTLTVEVGASVAPGTAISNGVTVTSATADGDLADNDALAETTVLSPATVSATKSVAGAFVPGSLVSYSVVLANAGPATQADNPGDELVDVLPAGLTLVGAAATFGVAFADLPNDTVTWNGSIPAAGSVTVTIEATIDHGVADGTVVANQGTAYYDADGDGTNESAAPTDDPTTLEVEDPTEFVVSVTAIQEIPTLDAAGLVLLALALAALAAATLRRRAAR